MTDYEKLKQITLEIPDLITANVSSSDPQFQAWKVKAERYLIGRYGKESFEYKDFKKTPFSLLMYASGTPHSRFVEACQNGLRQTQAIFQTYLDEMEEESSEDNAPEQPDDFSKVFIVHGHDGELKHSVARIVERQGIEAIILSEQANQGRTIIEKFIDYSNVGGAICLFTADDFGKAKEASDDNQRARQNVVFEAGFFIGRLGREHTVILADAGVEMPSDLSGIVYTDTRNWQLDLLRELNAMGYNVDLNKLL